ncbi:MAG TPA: ABC-2 transporter permease [Anaerolineaceae bacterium]|nr:ABC-2 transporter permease [Anaerolineaceae bacterium]
MYKILTIAIKDMLRSFRSLFAVGMMFVAPMLITGLIYLAFGSLSQGGSQPAEMQTLKVGIINLDQPMAEAPILGQLVIDFLKDPGMPSWLQVEEIAAGGNSETEIDLKTYGMVVVIPSNFSSAFVQRGSRASLDIYYDPALTIQPQVVKALLTNFTDGLSGTSIALDVTAKQFAERGVTIDPASQQKIITDFVKWSTDLQQNMQSTDPAISHLKMVSPVGESEQPAAEKPSPVSNLLGMTMVGQLIFFAFYTGAYTCMSILKEQEEGTLARLFTTPTARTSILTGKLLSVLFTVVVQILVLMLVSGLAFQINWGAPLAVALAVIGLVMAASGLGIFLISLLKSERQAGAVLGGGLTFAGMIGGLFTVAVPNMPAAFQTINLLMPHGWALRAFRVAMDGGGVSDLLLPLVVLLAFGGGLFALGAVLFRRRFA